MLGEIGNVLCLEDPIPRWKLNDYAQLKTFGTVPIVLHVSLPYIIHGQRIKDAIQAIELNAVDGFNFNCGIANFQRLGSYCSCCRPALLAWIGSRSRNSRSHVPALLCGFGFLSLAQ